MKHSLLFLLFLVFQNAFGQFGIIQDADGFVNVRKTPGIGNNILDTLHHDHIIFYFTEPKDEKKLILLAKGILFNSKQKLIRDPKEDFLKNILKYHKSLFREVLILMLILNT